MKKNLTKVGICALTSVVLLAGCASKSNTQAPSSTSNQSAQNNNAASTEKITLTMMTREVNTPNAAVFDQLSKEFMDKHPDITIKNDSIGDETAYSSKLKAQIASGNTPDYFYYGGVASLVDWAKNGLLMDITPLMDDHQWADGFVKGTLDTWNYEKYGVKGRFGIPTALIPTAIYYNKDLFAKAGIAKTPETTEDLLAAIEKLKAAKITPIALGAKDSWRAGHTFNNFLLKFVGVDTIKDLGAHTKKWTDPELNDAFAFLKKLNDQGAFPQGAAGIDFQTEMADFASGKAAMWIHGSWAVNDMNTKAGKDFVKDKMGVFPIPYVASKPEYKDDNLVFGQGMFVSGKVTGKKREALIEFVKFMTGKDAQTRFLKDGTMTPSRNDIDMSSLNLDPLLVQSLNQMSKIKHAQDEYSAYDPTPSLGDKSRIALVGLLLDKKPEEVAKLFQDEIDRNK